VRWSRGHAMAADGAGASGSRSCDAGCQSARSGGLDPNREGVQDLAKVQRSAHVSSPLNDVWSSQTSVGLCHRAETSAVAKSKEASAGSHGCAKRSSGTYAGDPVKRLRDMPVIGGAREGPADGVVQGHPAARTAGLLSRFWNS